MTNNAATKPDTLLPPGAQSRPRWLTGVLLAAIFVSGGLVGSAVTVLAERWTHIHSGAVPASDADMTALYDSMMLRVDRTVKLTDEQKPRVRAALEATYGPERRKMLRSMEPRIRDLFKPVTAKVLPLLTEEQKPRWEEFVDRSVKWWVSGAMRRPSSRGAPASQPTN